MHFHILQRLIDILVNGEIEAWFKPKAPKHTQGVIFEGNQRLQGSSYNMILDITQATFGVILDFSGVDVVEKTVDGEIPS